MTDKTIDGTLYEDFRYIGNSSNFMKDQQSKCNLICDSVGGGDCSSIDKRFVKV